MGSHVELIFTRADEQILLGKLGRTSKFCLSDVSRIWT